MVFCCGRSVTAEWFATSGGIGKRVTITSRASGCTEQRLEAITASQAALPYRAQQSALPLALKEFPDASFA